MSTSKLSNWWTRPCGARELLVLALPLIISTGSWALMHFTDRMFLTWNSELDVAAAMPAGLLAFTLICFPLGITAYTNTFVAQYHGAGRFDRIGPAVWQGVRIGLFATPCFLALIPIGVPLFHAIGHDSDLALRESTYFRILLCGAGAPIMGAALSAFFTGRGKTRVVMMVSVTSSLLNCLLDYALIFGEFGFPAMGIAGAAWATVISQWFRVIVYTALIFLTADWDKYGLITGLRFDGALFRRLLRYGGPSGLQFVIEVAAFTIFILAVGRLGILAMEATSIAFSINHVAFVPMLGLGIAVSTMVGQQIGKKQPDMAARVTWSAFWMALVYMGGMALIYVTLPGVILLGHKSGMEPDEFERLYSLAVVLLRFVAAYSLFDAANVIFVSAIKGAGDTRFVLLTSLVMSPLPVVIAWAGVTQYGFGLIWCWWVITVWICALGVIYLLRFLHGGWREMRVIESDS